MKQMMLIAVFIFSSLCWSYSPSVEVEGFVAGTLVKTPEGYTPIDSLRIGDLVMSCNFEGSCVERQILAVHERQAARYLKLEVLGETIGIGYSSMLFSPNVNFWTNATNIEVSSTLLNAQNQNVTITNIYPVLETTTLYSLSVEQFQNYFVSKADVLVHNYTVAELDAMLDRLSPREQAQVLIMETVRGYGLHNPAHLSYILATAEWETGYFKHMKEVQGERRPYAPYYGRGYIQLTHRVNYEKFSKILGQDLINNPDLAMDKRIAARIIVHGMAYGVFTGELKKDGIHWSGKKLVDYINGNGDGTGQVDFFNARRIVNGIDRAAEVAALATKWLKYFKDARGKPNGDIKFLKWARYHEEL